MSFTSARRPASGLVDVRTHARMHARTHARTHARACVRARVVRADSERRFSSTVEGLNCMAWPVRGYALQLWRRQRARCSDPLSIQRHVRRRYAPLPLVLLAALHPMLMLLHDRWDAIICFGARGGRSGHRSRGVRSFFEGRVCRHQCTMCDSCSLQVYAQRPRPWISGAVHRPI